MEAERGTVTAFLPTVKHPPPRRGSTRPCHACTRVSSWCPRHCVLKGCVLHSGCCSIAPLWIAYLRASPSTVSCVVCVRGPRMVKLGRAWQRQRRSRARPAFSRCTLILTRMEARVWQTRRRCWRTRWLGPLSLEVRCSHSLVVVVTLCVPGSANGHDRASRVLHVPTFARQHWP